MSLANFACFVYELKGCHKIWKRKLALHRLIALAGPFGIERCQQLLDFVLVQSGSWSLDAPPLASADMLSAPEMGIVVPLGFLLNFLVQF